MSWLDAIKSTSLDVVNDFPDPGTKSYERAKDTYERYVYEKNPYEFSQSELGKKMSTMDSNVLNYYTTEMAAYRDMLKWQATNEWNLEQWYRENQYNSPAAQKQRYLEAGINPLWAMSENNSAGNSSSVTTQQPHASPLFNATMEPARLAQEASQFAQSNALQAAGTFGELSVKERALLNEIRKTDSDITKTKAETALLKSQLESNDYLNKINSVTFDTQVNLKIEELNKVRQEIANLRKQEDLTDKQKEYVDAQIEYEKMLTNYTKAMAEKVQSETFDKLENLKQRWFALVSQRIQSNAAATSSVAAMQQAQTADAALNHQIEKDTKDLEMKSNEQILQVIDMQRGALDRLLGTTSNVVSGMLGNEDFTLAERAFSYINAGTKVIFNRFYNNPTKANADAVNKVMQKINEFQNSKSFDVNRLLPFSPGSSTLNPSESWN